MSITRAFSLNVSSRLARSKNEQKEAGRGAIRLIRKDRSKRMRANLRGMGRGNRYRIMANKRMTGRACRIDQHARGILFKKTD